VFAVYNPACDAGGSDSGKDNRLSKDSRRRDEKDRLIKKQHFPAKGGTAQKISGCGTGFSRTDYQN